MNERRAIWDIKRYHIERRKVLKMQNTGGT
jgi:hypothetical protein